MRALVKEVRKSEWLPYLEVSHLVSVASIGTANRFPAPPPCGSQDIQGNRVAMTFRELTPEIASSEAGKVRARPAVSLFRSSYQVVVTRDLDARGSDPQVGVSRVAMLTSIRTHCYC